MPRAAPVEVEVGGRTLSLSNLGKVLWPATGFTKGDMVDYYRAVAPALLPHVAGRPLTLRRYPDGVEASSFFEKRCPSHRPDWVPTITLGEVAYCDLAEPAALVWAANLAAIELHPTLGAAPDLDRPTAVVFDLDPGPGTDVVTCARVALWVREVLDGLSLRAWPKTSGSKGLQLYAPLDGVAGFDASSRLAGAVAALLERRHPELIVTTQERRLRDGKVLIDWTQNSPTKTTVAAYSLRAREAPTVSTPVTWDEVEAAAATGKPAGLRFEAADVLARLDAQGDLFSPVLEVRQRLPELGS